MIAFVVSNKYYNSRERKLYQIDYSKEKAMSQHIQEGNNIADSCCVA